MIANGRRIMEDPEDYNAQAEIMWCSSLSHNGLTEAGRGKDFSVHKFGHALSAKYHVAHGASLAAVWGSWAKYLYEGALDRFARFARKVWGIEEAEDAEAARQGMEATVDYFRSIGMPTCLEELGVKPSQEELEALALDATMNDSVKLSRIRPLGAKEALEILQMALR